MAEEKAVLIEHKDGRQYVIAADQLDKAGPTADQTYKEAGFKVVAYEDGSPYRDKREAPSHPTDKESKGKAEKAGPEPEPAAAEGPA